MTSVGTRLSVVHDLRYKYILGQFMVPCPEKSLQIVGKQFHFAILKKVFTFASRS